MSDLNKTQSHEKTVTPKPSPVPLKMPQSARDLLELLDKLDSFTISIEAKINDEVASGDRLVHLKLDNI